MANRFYSQGLPATGTLKGYVTWLMDHGYDPTDYQARIKARFPNARPSDVSRQINAYRARESAAETVGGLGQSDAIPIDSMFPNRAAPKGYRVVVKYRYNTVSDDEKINVRFLVDTNAYPTKRELMQAIRDTVVADLLSRYQSKGETIGSISQRLTRVTFESFELL